MVQPDANREHRGHRHRARPGRAAGGEGAARGDGREGATPAPRPNAIYRQYEQLAVNIRQNEQAGIVFPLVYDAEGNELYKLELLSSGGRPATSTRIP